MAPSGNILSIALISVLLWVAHASIDPNPKHIFEGFHTESMNISGISCTELYCVVSIRENATYNTLHQMNLQSRMINPVPIQIPRCDHLGNNEYEQSALVRDDTHFIYPCGVGKSTWFFEVSMKPFSISHVREVRTQLVQSTQHTISPKGLIYFWGQDSSSNTIYSIDAHTLELRTIMSNITSAVDLYNAQEAVSIADEAVILVSEVGAMGRLGFDGSTSRRYNVEVQGWFIGGVSTFPHNPRLGFCSIGVGITDQIIRLLTWNFDTFTQVASWDLIVDGSFSGTRLMSNNIFFGSQRAGQIAQVKYTDQGIFGQDQSTLSVELAWFDVNSDSIYLWKTSDAEPKVYQFQYSK